MDLGQDSPVSCLQISLNLTVATDGKLELEQISLLKFIFRITSEFEFGSLPNSIKSFRCIPLKDTRSSTAVASDGGSTVAGSRSFDVSLDCFALGLIQLKGPTVLCLFFQVHFVLFLV